MQVMAAIAGCSAQLVDADQVTRGIAEGAVANPVRLLGRLLDDVGAAGLQPCEDALMTDQSSGRAAKAFFVFLYHPIPDTGCFHLSCMLFRALLCVSSPPASLSFRWLSCAFITSSALFPWNGASHGPPICLHVIVFIFITCFSSVSAGMQHGSLGGRAGHGHLRKSWVTSTWLMFMAVTLAAAR